MHPANVFLAAVLGSTLGIGGLTSRRRAPVTDAMRLKRLDAAEEAYHRMLANPHFIAAAAKRERRRLKRQELVQA